MKILLVCSAGMSTSLLVKKMEKAALEAKEEHTIWAVATDAADHNMAKADVVLIGPQIRFQLPEMKKKGEKYNIPVETIPSIDYGMCNGPKVLAFAKKAIAEYKK
jgi:cellobiose PTS system EIIB component